MRRTALAVLAFVAAPLRVEADEENPAAVQVIQRRQFELKHELTVSAGFLPLDAFYKGITANLAYTYHFSPSIAWRVARGTFSQSIDTKLRSEVKDQYGLLVTPYPEVRWIFGTDLVWNAFYGKTSFMNVALLHGGIYLLVGGGAMIASATQADGAVKTDVVPSVNVGGGLRLFATEWLSFRLEVLDHVVIAKRSFNVVDLQLAVAFNLGT